jgi:hypothetical protein
MNNLENQLQLVKMLIGAALSILLIMVHEKNRSVRNIWKDGPEIVSKPLIGRWAGYRIQSSTWSPG